MTDTRSPSPPGPPPLDEPELSADVQRLLASATLEAPKAELAEQIREGLDQRRALEQWAPPVAPSRLRWLGLGAGLGLGLSAAAAAALWLLPHRDVSVTPERVGLGPSGAPVIASGARLPTASPPVDPCLGAPRAEGTQPLIDDFEDGDDAILPLEGRKALWRWSRDTDLPGTAPALLPIPRPGSAADNRLAAHVKGGTLKDWGALVEMRFSPTCYDASVYAGLAFTARGSGRIYVSPREVSVIPRELGGTCDSDCYNGHVLKIELTERWTTYEVRWEQLAQRGYDRPALNPARLHDLAFLVRPEDTPYDVWLDDVRFLKR